ncbi:hypothetical protein [Primorskyibacter sp. S187A]|uniref:hypothetical protein n=1 Tax=Primorskyibacter sp. S187A TaxID=3415130 RepID=UPI003C7A011F
MTKFSRLVSAVACTVALGTLAQANVVDPGATPVSDMTFFQSDVLMAQAAPRSSYSGNWYVAPNGCAYSRAQAPGHSPMWILIQNPHHLGLPNASGNCPTTL